MMIKLDYLYDVNAQTNLYTLIQKAAGQPFVVHMNEEVIASINKISGVWKQLSGIALGELLLAEVGGFIDAQNYQKLPDEIKKHWADDVQEAIATSDDFYLIITKPEIDFERFEKTFSNYIVNLIKDEWQITFRVCNSDFSGEFTTVVPWQSR